MINDKVSSSEHTLFDLLQTKRRSKTHNYNCHSKKFPLCQSEKFMWHTRLSRVAILQSSVDDTTRDSSNIRVTDTNSYCLRTIDSCLYTLRSCR